MTPKAEKERDYYADLGVASQESLEEIRKAYEILIAGINLISKSFNPSLAAHSEEERRIIEIAWSILGDEQERKNYDARRGAIGSRYGRYSLGYEEKTGTARRPSAPKIRNSHNFDLTVMGDGISRSRVCSVVGKSGGAADWGFDGFLGFGRPVEKEKSGIAKEMVKRGFSGVGAGPDGQKENQAL